MATRDLDRSIGELSARDHRFRADAYHFVLDALDHTLAGTPQAAVSGGETPDGTPSAPSNVSGTRLLHGFRDLALERYGVLARQVLAHWGITRTEDVGAVVFHMVDAGLLQKTPSDCPDDYRDVFDFETAFERAFEERLRSGEVRIPARRED